MELHAPPTGPAQKRTPTKVGPRGSRWVPGQVLPTSTLPRAPAFRLGWCGTGGRGFTPRGEGAWGGWAVTCPQSSQLLWLFYLPHTAGVSFGWPRGAVRPKPAACGPSALGGDVGGPPASASASIFEISTLNALEQGLSFWVRGRLA